MFNKFILLGVTGDSLNGARVSCKTLRILLTEF